MPRKSHLIDAGDDTKPQSVRAERGSSAKGVGKKRKKGDAVASKIRKHIKGVVDVKRVGTGVYEVAIA